jgi:hypothetical protein
MGQRGHWDLNGVLNPLQGFFYGNWIIYSFASAPSNLVIYNRNKTKVMELDRIWQDAMVASRK